jgi:hypothetical protein
MPPLTFCYSCHCATVTYYVDPATGDDLCPDCYFDYTDDGYDEDDDDLYDDDFFDD